MEYTLKHDYPDHDYYDVRPRLRPRGGEGAALPRVWGGGSPQTETSSGPRGRGHRQRAMTISITISATIATSSTSARRAPASSYRAA